LDRRLHVLRLGRIEYQKAWDLQKHLFLQRLVSKIGDVLILCEHPHTYTIGRDGAPNAQQNLLLSKEELTRRGIQLYEIDRGGDITYHGPGQIVGYPILDLNRHYRDVHRYLRDIEEVIMRTLLIWNIQGRRIDKITGVWVDSPNGPQKICAIGVKVSRWITMHGFAFNINTDLTYFSGIIPCGISDKGVTSVKNILKRDHVLADFEKIIINNFCDVFNVSANETILSQLNLGIGL
jgi:lipoyl(octanoyl) transferase